MKHLLRSIGLAAAFSAGAAIAQSPHAQHGLPSGPADKPPQQQSEVKAGNIGGPAFRNYQRFNADEPRKDWRAANEEVRASGGHMGLMKGVDSSAGHAGHQPAETGKGPKK